MPKPPKSRFTNKKPVSSCASVCLILKTCVLRFQFLDLLQVQGTAAILLLGVFAWGTAKYCTLGVLANTEC